MCGICHGIDESDDALYHSVQESMREAMNRPIDHNLFTGGKPLATNECAAVAIDYNGSTRTLTLVPGDSVTITFDKGKATERVGFGPPVHTNQAVKIKLNHESEMR